MELALGTVQFGLAYGALGSGQVVPESVARDILAAAWQDGVRVLDTAAAYGDIEARLGALCGPHDFRIVSKIRPLGGLPQPERLHALLDSIRQSLQHLDDRLDTLLFHSAADLLAPEGPQLWDAADALLRQSGRSLQLGASCYAPEELLTLRQRFDIRAAQLPANAFDQRLLHAMQEPRHAVLLAGVELHVRSAFLQGLLLSPAQGATRVPAAATALAHWQSSCEHAAMAPAVAALSQVQALPGVSCCVVGVESLVQWQEVSEAWRQAQPRLWPALAQTDAQVFDPRLWPKQAPAEPVPQAAPSRAARPTLNPS